MMVLVLSEFRWYYGILGLVLVVAFFSPAKMAYNYSSRGVEAEATVKEFAAQKTKLSAGAMVSFAFQDARGKKHTGSDNVYGDWYPPPNNIIRIRYLPDNPGNTAVVEGNINRLPITIFCGGVVVVLLAVVAEFHVRRKRKPGKLD